MKKIALIDNDFVQKLAEIKSNDVFDNNNKDDAEKQLNSRNELVRMVFDGMSVVGRMHELVYKNEFMNQNNAQKFFDDSIFSIQYLKEIFDNDPNKKSYYCILVPELYRRKTGEEIENIGIKDVLNDWIRKKSLGEYHSLAACYIGGYALFLSDDNGSKKIADILDVHYRKRIEVYSREDFVKRLNDIKPGLIKRDDRRIFSHKK